MAKTLSRDELDALGVTCDIPTAGRAFGLGKTQSYVYAQEGKFPIEVLQVGSRLFVRTADLRRYLGLPA